MLEDENIGGVSCWRMSMLDDSLVAGGRGEGTGAWGHVV